MLTKYRKYSSSQLGVGLELFFSKYCIVDCDQTGPLSKSTYFKIIFNNKQHRKIVYRSRPPKYELTVKKIDEIEKMNLIIKCR